MAIDVFLGMTLINEHVHTILTNKQKVAARKSTSVFTVKQHNVSTNALFRKENTQVAILKTHFQTIDNQGSTS